ncbi:MAG: hypothetical protein AB8B53_09945 [Flavobacteriales bacterium]
MLGLILIYFLGKAFYDLAAEHGRSRWGTAISGVCFYIALQVLFVVVLIFVVDSFETINTFLIDIIGIGVGALAAYILYQYLKFKWENQPVHSDYELLDDDLTL